MRFNKSIKKHLLVILVPILVITVNSCYDDYGMTTSDYDIVLTQFDEEGKFGQYKTFALIDSVFHITESGEDSEILSRQYDSDVLERVESNLLSMGYVKQENPQENTPDVLLVVGATASRNVNIYSWYPGYGGWYGWYYPWYSVSSYDLGTLLIFYMDTNDIDLEEEKYKAVWLAGINGVLSRADSDLSRINSYIDQAFKQSDYLTPNQ